MVPVQELIAAGQPDFVITPGDLTYANANGQDAVDQHFNDVMVWSRDAAYMPAWGNHEWDDNGGDDDLRNYKGRFDLPNPQTSPGSPAISCCGEDWYWFDYGNVRFIAYPEPWPGAWADWAVQADLVMDQAELDPDIGFIVTVGHQPPYSSGHHPSDAGIATILDTLGAEHPKYVLNLNGHSHNYERTWPQNGVVHLTTGTGGGTLQTDGSCLWNTCVQPEWSAFRAFRYGAVRLDFSSEAIDGAFICGPPSNRDDIDCIEGEVVDTFQIGTTAPPNGTIDAPIGDVEIDVGQTVTFEGTGSDPDGDPALRYLWDFNGVAPNSTEEDPGAILFDTSGAFTTTFTVTDSTGRSDPTPAHRTVAVFGPDGTLVAQSSPAQSADDAEESATGQILLVSSDLELVEENTIQTVGIRFPAVHVPAGATVTDAFVQFRADEISSGASALTIRAERSIDPGPFRLAHGDITSRATTTAQVLWSPAAWSALGEAGPDQQTPNLAPVINEVLDQPGWQGGDAIVLIVTGTGRRVAESFDRNPAAAAKLFVEFELGELSPTVSIDTPLEPALFDESLPVRFTATGSDPDSNDPLSYLWEFDGGAADQTVEDPGDVWFPGPGSYTVTVTVTDSDGKSGSDQVEVTIVHTVTQLTVANAVVNDDGGTRLAGDFPLFVDGTPVAAGSPLDLGAGSYVVSQASQPGYATILAGDCAPDGSITLSPGEGRTCTFTNDDIAPQLTVTKTVVNDDGGSKITSDFSLFVDGAPVTAGLPGSYGIGAHIVSEAPDPAYTPALGGDCASDGSVTLALGDQKVCALINDDVVGPTPPNSSIDSPIGRVQIGVGQTVRFEGTGSDPNGDSSLTYLWNFGGAGPDSTLEDPGDLLFDTPGAFTTTFTVTDSTGRVDPTPDRRTISVLDPEGKLVVEAAPTSSTDDAEEKSTGQMLLTSSDLEIVQENTLQTVGIRFPAVHVPVGATVVDAFVQFQADEVSSGASSLMIRAESDSSPQPFQDVNFDISSRPTTAAQVGWSPAPWNAIGEAGPDQRTPNLAPVIQELLDGPGWQGDNPIVLILTGTGKRTAESFDGIQAAAPRLFVEFALEQRPPTVTIDSPTTTPSGALSSPVHFAATADEPDGDHPLSYAWDFDGAAPDQDVEDPGYLWLAPGIYSITLTVTDTEGMSASDAVDVIIGSLAQLTVTNVVINDDGGTLTTGDFPLFVDGEAVTSGAPGSVPVGSHQISQTQAAGYATTIGGDCLPDGSISLGLGEIRHCIIINDDIAPQLTVTKTVVNDSGGNKNVSDFALFVDGAPVASGVPGFFGVGSHVVSETQDPGYLASFGGDCAPDGTLTLAPGDQKTCTIANDDKPQLTVVKIVVNNDGGTREAGDFELLVDGSPVVSGIPELLGIGPHLVSETPDPGYTPRFFGDCAAGGEVELTPTDVRTCWIVNDDVAAQLTVYEVVVNDDGGAKSAGDFALFIDCAPVPPGTTASLPGGRHLVYAIRNPDYALTFSGHCDVDGWIDLLPGDTQICIVTHDDIAP
jgi:PKD repeat protein